MRELFAVGLALSILAFGLAGLVAHAVVCLTERTASVLKRYTAKQMLVSMLSVLVSGGVAVAQALVLAFGSLLRWWLLFLAVFAGLAALHVTYTEYPSVWLSLLSYYNALLGPLIHQTVVVPLQVADVLLRALLPLWNALFWFLKALGVQALLPILIEQAQLVLRMAGALVSLVKHLSLALFTFIDGFRCAGVACLRPEAGVLDVLSSLASLREFVALGVELLRAFCATLAAPIDVLVAPLLDLNLAEGVHSLFNAAIQLFLVVPRNTWVRCGSAGSSEFALMLCTPDLAPVFNFLSAALGSLGLVVDNWLNIAYLIVEQVVSGGEGAACDAGYGGAIPDIVADAGVFPGGRSVVVGLTRWVYAVTDGLTAVYGGSTDLDVRVQRWPFAPYAMSLDYGFAAVAYAPAGAPDVSALSEGVTSRALQTTAMLGCNCTDTPAGVELRCSILPFAGIPPGAALADYLVRVLFPDAQTPGLLTCGGLDIYVRTVRWPFTRYTQPGAGTATIGSSTVTLGTTDCISRGTCRSVDATVWVVPRCGQDASLLDPRACQPTASCFPFCMAARSTGAGADSLILAGARRWRSGLTLLGQDCGIGDTPPDLVQPSSSANGPVSRVESGPGSLLSESGLPSAVYARTPPGAACRPAARITSVVDKPRRVAGNVLGAGQPFVVVGDALLTEQALGGDRSSVLVERLGGDEGGVFSLQPTGLGLPAEPRRPVPADEGGYDGGDHLLLPYQYQTTWGVATASRDYVFYASNPTLDAFGAYFAYCSRPTDDEGLPKFGLLFRSSYAPIRIYRVAAYRRCLGAACGPGLVRYAAVPSFATDFSKSCRQNFTSRVLAMEYLNEDNIAVTLEVTSARAWREATQDFGGPLTRTRTVWLNPPTMRLQDTIFQTDLPSSSYTALCPQLQRLPRLGSFGAELANAGLYLARALLFGVLYTPAMVPIWARGDRCPSGEGGALFHAVLGDCGRELYSLDDFFDSLEDASAIFWHSLTLLGQLVRGTAGERATPLADVLAGMEQYGVGTVDLWTAQATLLTLTRLPLREQLAGLWGAVRSGPSNVQGAANVGQTATAWCRFVYRRVSTIALAIVKRVLQGQAITFGGVWALSWGNLFDAQDEFASTVTAHGQLGCAGLRLMFGLGNPWSDLIYHQCVAGLQLVRGMMSLGLNLFVQIPMVKCACKDASGQNLLQFVQGTCAALVPTTLLPSLYMISARERGQNEASGLACASVLASAKSAIKASLDPWFQAQYAALDALHGVLDYALFAFEPDAGRCMDFDNDPHVVVIVPNPTEYFQGCARTSRCKAVCRAEWERFQAVARPPVTLPDIPVVVDSVFFPGQMDPALTLANATAAIQFEPAGACLARPPDSPPDLALAVAEVEGVSVTVRYWCVPLMPSSSLYPSTRTRISVDGLPGLVLRAAFGSPDWLALLLQVQGEQVTCWVDADGLHVAPSVLDSLAPVQHYMGIMDLWVFDGAILVSVLTRQASGVTSAVVDGGVVPLSYAPFGNVSFWVQTTVDLTAYGNHEYWVTTLGNGQTLFLPKQSGLPSRRARIFAADGELYSTAMDTLAPTDLAALQGLVLAGASVGTDYALAVATSGWDWLQRVSFGGESGTLTMDLRNSIPVSLRVSVQGNCNERGCEGCPDVQVQRMCLAYSKCALVNCVGTPVHQRKPLCGIGALLKHAGQMALTSTEAAWTVFAEMLGLLLDLRLLSLREAHLLWPEDRFLCHVCAAKDGSAEFFSILTSILNTALQLGRANVGYLYGGATNVDRNADAVLTVSNTALNAFMHQIALAPLFAMVASHQVMMCQTEGLLALVSRNDTFRVSLQPADQTSEVDAVAGQCLTLGAAAMAQYPSDDPKGLGAIVASTATNAVQLLLVQQIEPLLHYMDTALSYGIGVVQSFGVLVMSQNMAKCNPPDFNLAQVVTCACGDQPLGIQAASRKQGIPERAHWCSGVLSMLDGDGRPIFVYNPYTYAQVQALAAGMQAYLECVRTGTSGYTCAPPTDPVFQAQGVNALNVLVACRDNFVKRRWDPAAFVLYNRLPGYALRYPGVVPIPAPDACGVRACMREEAGSIGALSKACLERHLQCTGLSEDDYWQYEHVALGAPEYTDACLVFYGPAQERAPPFALCVDGPGEGACTLPAHCWTPLSSNNVPVCEQHRVLSAGAHRDGLVQRLYARARRLVQDAVQASVVRHTSGSSRVNASLFSVEGDVLHQTMDCIFMGPYSRVDYWPMPACLAGQECLDGPYWARDEEGGATRAVDPDTCPSETELPYTCGSPARRALMRYFLNDFLGARMSPNSNRSLIREILLRTLDEHAQDWADTGRFGCPCAYNASVALPSCCLPGGPLLPPRLARNFTSIPTQHVLAALDDDFRDIARLAVDDITPFRTHLDAVRPFASPGWDWRGSQRAEDEARLNPVSPSLSYGADEAQTPFLFTNSTLWDTCHAALKQVLFTLPLDDAGLLAAPMEQFDGNASRIEEFIARFTAEAFKRSPLYRHYAPKHAPSDSAMCLGPQSVDQSEGSAAWDDLVQGGSTLLDRRSSVLRQLPSYRPQRFRVGEEACLCGWARGPLGCQAPPSACPEVCRRVACAQGCWYRPDDGPVVLAAFRDEWACPEAELSPHWGVLDAAAMEDWLARNLTSATLSTRELLTHGRAGLRVGNLGVLASVSKRYVAPDKREIPLERGRITTCPSALAAWPKDLTERFVDQLFPAAQGVESSGAAAYCLRHAIEVARFTVLNLTLPLDPETLAQRETVQRWRSRCGAQLQLVHLCASLDMYRPRTSLSVRACPHFTVIGLGPDDYTTPECLVRVNGAFHDPCRCLACEGRSSAQISVADFRNRPECMIRFDPHQLLPLGVPIGWVDGLAPDPPSPPPDLAETLLADPDAVSNTNAGKPWWGAEGWMADNSEFCDMVQDWWPDEWDFPVGYHVTVPCDAGDTAYRSFLQAFALDVSGPAPRMVYQHDLLRDADLVDTHFGVGGLCRATSFGMPMPVTNTMRYCTAPPLDGTEDFTMPSTRASEGAYADFRCTQAHSDLPWPDSSIGAAPYDASLRSVGTVPHMPPPDSPVYPSSAEDTWDVGPWQEIVSAGNDWGAACSDYPLYKCVKDGDCYQGFTCRGRVCSNNLARSCAGDGDCEYGGVCRGVCLDPNTECIRHSDCDGDRMCTGVGTCERPTVVVDNDLQTPASFRLATGGACPNGSRPYSLLGGSHWAYTSDDLLRAHGMCSFEDWFKYTYGTLAQCQTGEDATSFQINPSTCPLLNLEASGSGNSSTWWSPSKQRPDFMYLRPTNCDRDHERLAGFQQCAPTPDTAIVIDKRRLGRVTSGLAYDPFVRLHESRTLMRLARMPESGSQNLGFLGLGLNYTSLKPLQQAGDHAFVSCGSLSQCYEPDFLVRGQKANRTLESGALYPPDAYFSCGSFGYPDPQTKQCKLDMKVFPLYRYLCDPNSQIQSCTDLLGPARTPLCLAISTVYDAQNTQRKAQLKALTELFYSFPSFTTRESYLDTTLCMSEMYAAMQGGSLYFPFMYSLYELPFDWFYQCMVMMPGLRVDVTARGNQDCEQFKNRERLQIGAYTLQAERDSWLTYVRRVRGGYLWEDFRQFVTQQSQAMANSTQAAREDARRFYYRSTAEDRSVQACSVNMIWDIGQYGTKRRASYDASWRALIYNYYDAQTCQPTWQEQLLQRAKDRGGLTASATTATWVQAFTMPDPDKKAAPPGLDTTMLAAIADFMLRSGVATQEDVTSGNQGCFGFNLTIRPDASESGILRDYPSLRLQKDSPGTLTSAGGDDSDKTCVFAPEDDDAIPKGAVCSDVQLTTQRQNRIYAKSCALAGRTYTCTLVPAAHRYGGFFSCHYPVENEDAGFDRFSAENVLAQMYARVRQNYLLRRPAEARLQARRLPWFDRDWTFDGFDLSEVLNFQSNIQPNPNKAVMCTINTNQQSATQFMQCQSPHYQAIKAHAFGAYKRDGAVAIPAQHQLEWQVGRAALARGVIVSYANQNRTQRQMYMDALFDDATVCTDSAMSTRVCWRNTTGVFTPMNPWLLGNFNPYSMCDVEFSEQSQQFTETIFSSCNDGGDIPNPACPVYGERWVRQECKPLAQSVVPQPGVPPLGTSEGRGQAYTYLDYNLCKHTLVEDSRGCLEDQGLLGGYDGLPVAAPPGSYSMIRQTPYEGGTYKVAASLYEESVWDIPAAFRGGLLAGTNPLWSGAPGPFGHLQVDEDELGGHRVGLKISRATASDQVSQLLVDRAFLSSGGAQVLAGASGSLPVSAWVPDLRASMQADHASNLRLYQLVYTEQPETSASCPLQRWAFYSGGYRAFSPTLPSPQRSRHLFYRIHQGLFAHPTMRQSSDGLNIGAYRTSNGFCACPVLPDIPQPQCLVPVGASTDCSLLSTIQILAGLKPFGVSQAFAPLDSNLRPRQCTMQLDWPNINGTLRDGAPHAGKWEGASSVTGRQCHVLDRLQSFRYRYVSDTRLTPTGLNTVRDGVCQTRRAVLLNGTTAIPAGRCVRSGLSSTEASIACTSTSSRTSLPRRTPLTPGQTADRWRARRQRCSTCSPPPAFTTQEGKPIPAESSFGRLFRPSTERMLAKDLRDALCGATGTCPPFNRSAWAQGRFMQNYLRDPASLFLWTDSRPAPPQPPPAPPPNTDASWEGKGWVLCPNIPSLRAGAGCKGTIPRHIWQRDRAGTCARMIRSFYNGTSAGDPMARAPFCNIDQTTSDVCAAIVQARALVQQANCIASGESTCLPQPYVYHPATYEASNHQWVRDTVTSFYQQINASLCQASGPDVQALFQYTRTYQEECPATSVALLVTVMRVVRTVLTDVALLLTTMGSMAIKLLAMLVQDPTQVRALRRAAGADWALIKRKAGAAMDSAGDMLLDGMLNSGSAGKGVLQFLSRVCEQINQFLSWLVGVWCRYVKKYMINMLLALQRLVGMIGTGFEIVNDLMDYLFAGILPAQLAAKYGNQMFQTLMQERYSKPTAHKDSVDPSRHVPTAANLRPVDGSSDSRNSRISRNRDAKIVDNTMDIVGDALGIGDDARGKGRGSFLKTAGRGAGALGAAITAYEIVDGIMDLKNTLGNYYPENFTLFDLQDIVDSISDMIQYLQQDTTCYRYDALQRENMSYALFPCFKLDMSQYDPAGARGTTSISASICWADAQPSLGQSSLLSCTAGSTCCRTRACADFILCESCPATLPGTNRYGCDGLRQQCVCGQPASAVSTCSSNGQCGTDAQCTLASTRAGVSYGTIPCALCPATEQVMCMLPLSGLPGQCSCLFTDSLQYDLCADPSGSRTIVDPNKVCGYVPGYSLRASEWAFGLDDIMLVSCAQAVVGVCATVSVPDAPALQMVMAVTVRTTGARRLLSLEDSDPITAGEHDDYASLAPATLELVLQMDGWDATWDPCRSLVAAHLDARPLGVLDEYELRRCAYWRFVGHRVVTRYNLTTLEDTFLVSWFDLGQALLDPVRARTLLGALPAIAHGALYHPWMRPVRAMAMDLVAALDERRWARRLRTAQLLDDAQTRSPSQESDLDSPVLPKSDLPSHIPEPRDDHRAMRPPSRGRRLLQAAQSVQADIQAVLALSAQIIRGAPVTGSRAWNAGDPAASSFPWPPVYNYSLSACPIGLSVLRLGGHVAFVQKMYYANFDDIRQPIIDRSLRATLPSVPPLPINASAGLVRRASGWVSSGFHTLLAALGSSPEDLLAFLTSDQPDGLRWLLGTAVTCDLASVNTCSRHKRDLIMSVVVFLLGYLAASTVGNALGFPLLGTLMLFSFPGFILWYTFGVGLTCFPLLPTCLLSDIIAAIEYVAPARIRMPAVLLDVDGFTPCERLGFGSWYDTLAFAMCDTDRRACEALAGLALPFANGALEPFRGAVARLGVAMDDPAYDPSPYRVCAWVSFVWVVPVAALVLAVSTLAYTGANAVIGMLPSLTLFLGQTLVFYNTPR